MREIGHFIGGKEVKGGIGALRRRVSIPIPARCRPRSPSPSVPRSSTRSPVAEAAQPAWAADQSAAARARAVEVPRTGAEGIRQPRQASLLRARQDLRRRQGRHPARPRSGRVRLRHPAPAQGRIHRGRRPRHRPVFDAPAARRRRRHHAVQFSGHDPDVEVRAGARLRQRLHPQALGARSVGADAACRTAGRGRTAGRRAQRRQRRQGSGRHAARPIRASRRSASSAPRRSPNTSTRPAAPTANACNASAAPRTT